MILSIITAKLRQRAKADFKGRHYEAALIVQTVSWYLRYPLSYRDIEELFLERGVEVDYAHAQQIGKILNDQVTGVSVMHIDEKADG